MLIFLFEKFHIEKILKSNLTLKTYNKPLTILVSSVFA